MAEDVPISFFPTGGLYLKSLALITIEVRLPEIRNPGVTVSNWEIMEKIKEKSKPENYQNLRVALSSRELIRFEGEFESVRSLRKVNLLLNGKTIKLRGFPDPLKIRSFQTETLHPAQHQWEEHFAERGVASFDEGKYGERADTVHIKGLPVRWFASKDSCGKPCPKVLTDAFQKFGKVRQVGFYDPSDDSTQKGFSSFGPGAATQVLNFEAYIQYEKYTSFVSAMEGLRNVQLLRLQAGGQAMVKIKVDFDRTGFLSDRGIKRRLLLEEKAKREREEEEKRHEEKRREEERKREEEQKQREKEEEEKRLKKQEEKRKRKKEQEELEIKLKEVAIQRRTEALRLMRVLLAKAAETKCQEELKEKAKQDKARQLKEEAKRRDELISSVHQLEQRRQELEKELKWRKRRRSSGDLMEKTQRTKYNEI